MTGGAVGFIGDGVPHGGLDHDDAVQRAAASRTSGDVLVRDPDQDRLDRRARASTSSSTSRRYAACGGIAGLGTVGSGVASGGVVWSNGYGTGSQGIGVIGHELGHNLGLGHSQLLDCSVSGVRVMDAPAAALLARSYGDTNDIMAVSWDTRASSTPSHLRSLGAPRRRAPRPTPTDERPGRRCAPLETAQRDARADADGRRDARTCVEYRAADRPRLVDGDATPAGARPASPCARSSTPRRCHRAVVPQHRVLPARRRPRARPTPASAQIDATRSPSALDRPRRRHASACAWCRQYATRARSIEYRTGDPALRPALRRADPCPTVVDAGRRGSRVGADEADAVRPCRPGALDAGPSRRRRRTRPRRRASQRAEPASPAVRMAAPRWFATAYRAVALASDSTAVLDVGRASTHYRERAVHRRSPSTRGWTTSRAVGAPSAASAAHDAARARPSRSASPGAASASCCSADRANGSVAVYLDGRRVAIAQACARAARRLVLAWSRRSPTTGSHTVTVVNLTGGTSGASASTASSSCHLIPRVGSRRSPPRTARHGRMSRDVPTRGAP